MKLIEKHKMYYSSLFVILALGFFSALQVSYAPQIQLTIVVFTAFCYTLWGVVHHILEHDLTVKIVVEYVLMAALGISVVFFLTMGKM